MDVQSLYDLSNFIVQENWRGGIYDRLVPSTGKERSEFDTDTRCVKLFHEINSWKNLRIILTQLLLRKWWLILVRQSVRIIQFSFKSNILCYRYWNRRWHISACFELSQYKIYLILIYEMEIILKNKNLTKIWQNDWIDTIMLKEILPTPSTNGHNTKDNRYGTTYPF